MRSGCDTGVGERKNHGAQAKDEKRDGGGCNRVLYIVGLGPGGQEHLSIRAREAVEKADAVAGYTTYLDLIRPLISGKKIIASGMKKEVERVWSAVRTALSGTSCALVASGDPGVYALAGLAFELCRENGIGLSEENSAEGRGIRVEVVPGIPALCSGAALLGAPLVHDFAAISLSDLLTPWETIEKRLAAAAEADFVIVLYNPRSKKRTWQLERAREIVSKSRPPETPVGIVTGAMRENQSVTLTTLVDLDPDMADMQTTVFIGNSRTFVFENKMVTPRGYDNKYRLEFSGEKRAEI